MPQHRCHLCDQPIDACPNPVGAHLLCPPTAECRHELCQLLAGDLDDYAPVTARKAAS
jgi:hypothetical protein